MSRIKRHKTS